jgi:Polyketide cyclase / dehydrase and lipid transport
MWTFEYRHPTTASPDAVWALWSDVTLWPEWDTDLDLVALDGEFAPGTTGTLKPKGMDGFGFTITRAEPSRGYSDETPLPGAVLRFDHDLLEAEKGIVIRQRITMDGPAANQYFADFAGKIILDIPGALSRIAERAERIGTPS